MEKGVVYHGSSKAGLTRLEPFECKHGRPYVYATTDYLVVLHFAAKGQGMFDGWVEDDESGVPVFYEARHNSFIERYWNKSSYCYKLPSETFSCKTGDEYEVVSETPVDIIGCDFIENVGAEFNKFIEQGKFRVVKYNTSEKNTQEICNNRALKLLVDRGYFEGKKFRQRKWASEYYKNLIEDYLNNQGK